MGETLVGYRKRCLSLKKGGFSETTQKLKTI